MHFADFCLIICSTVLTTNLLSIFSKSCFSFKAIASPFLLFIRFFSSFFIAYIFPLILLWHAQTWNTKWHGYCLVPFINWMDWLTATLSGNTTLKSKSKGSKRYHFICSTQLTKWQKSLPLQIHLSLVLCNGGKSSLWPVVWYEKIQHGYLQLI